MSYPPGPQDPYGTPPQQYGYPQQQPQPQQPQPQAQPQPQPQYGYPQQPQPQYGCPQQPPAQQPYGYSQPGYDANAQYGYPQAGVPQGAPPPAAGYVMIPSLGMAQVAGMGARLGARLLDGLVTSLVIVIALFAGLASALGMHGSTGSANHVGLIFTLMGVVSGVALLYEWLMIAFLGQTLGKMALGLRVVRERDGQHPGLGYGFVRFILPVVGFFLCYIGVILIYISPTFDNSGKTQGWHDKAAGTLVVKR